MTKPKNKKEADLEFGSPLVFAAGVAPARPGALCAGRGRGRPSIWPFEELEVDGAFAVPDRKENSVRQLVSRRNRSGRTKGGDKKVFVVGRDAKGDLYVWRTA